MHYQIHETAHMILHPTRATGINITSGPSHKSNSEDTISSRYSQACITKKYIQNHKIIPVRFTQLVLISPEKQH